MEVRHPQFFAKGEEEQTLNRGLHQRGVNRVILDSRPVHAACPHSEATVSYTHLIPWERKTVTPASLWHHPGLVLIHAEGVETPQPELTEAV